VDITGSGSCVVAVRDMSHFTSLLRVLVIRGNGSILTQKIYVTYQIRVHNHKKIFITSQYTRRE